MEVSQVVSKDISPQIIGDIDKHIFAGMMLFFNMCHAASRSPWLLINIPGYVAFEQTTAVICSGFSSRVFIEVAPSSVDFVSIQKSDHVPSSSIPINA